MRSSTPYESGCSPVSIVMCEGGVHELGATARSKPTAFSEKESIAGLVSRPDPYTPRRSAQSVSSEIKITFAPSSVVALPVSQEAKAPATKTKTNAASGRARRLMRPPWLGPPLASVPIRSLPARPSDIALSSGRAAFRQIDQARSGAEVISRVLPVGSAMTARKMPSGPGPGPKANSPPRSTIWAVRARKSLVATAMCGANGDFSGWNSGFSTTWSSDEPIRYQALRKFAAISGGRSSSVSDRTWP